MEKQLIPVYADLELMRRIELAAAKHNVLVTEYCLDAIEQKLADEGLLDEKNTEILGSCAFTSMRVLDGGRETLQCRTRETALGEMDRQL
jgi:hypothetical protein